MRKLAYPLMAALAMAAAVPAQADTLTSYLDVGASFANGATMNLAWTFNSTTQQVTDINVGLQDLQGYYAFTNANLVSTILSQGNGPNVFEFYAKSNEGVKLYVDFNATTGELMLANGRPSTPGVNFSSYWPVPPLGQDCYNPLTGAGGYKITSPWTPPVPEPASAALMLSGLGVMGLLARRRRAAPSDVELAAA